MSVETIAREFYTDEERKRGYEYRVGRVVEPGYYDKTYRVEIRVVRPDGSTSEWESALFGNVGSQEAALNRFADRYRANAGLKLEVLDPTLKEKFAERERGEKEKSVEAERKLADEVAKNAADAERLVRLRAAFKQAKFRVQEVGIQGESGVIGTQRVPTIGGLAVTSFGEGKWKRWSLTHVGTGLAIGNEFTSQEQAKIAAFRLAELVDWTKDGIADALVDKKIKGVGAFAKMMGGPSGNVYVEKPSGVVVDPEFAPSDLVDDSGPYPWGASRGGARAATKRGASRSRRVSPERVMGGVRE